MGSALVHRKGNSGLRPCFSVFSRNLIEYSFDKKLKWLGIQMEDVHISYE